MNVRSLTLEQLDYWVAKARDIKLISSPTGGEGFFYQPHPSMAPRQWAPSRLWSQGGPIIEESHIDLNWDWEEASEWTASTEPDINAQGKSILEAAMRTYLISKFGEEITG